ncbi:MAG: hypothetical protein U1F19_00470 [Lysobacterales bacterium]
MDILTLQKPSTGAFRCCVFLKRQLFWVPLLGLAWWALDFPFMGRYSPKRSGQESGAGWPRYRCHPACV